MRLTHKSQSALEYMMTYGWAILIIVIVAVILYSMGIFNPSSSVTFTSSGFSPFVIQSTVCTADGLAFSVLAGPISSQVVQINRVYLTSASGTNSTSVSYILPKAVTLASGSSTLIVIPGIHCSAVGIKFSSSGSIEYSYSTPAGNEVLNATGTITGTTSSAPAKLPSSIEYFIPITISNKQSSATSTPFQQMVNITSSSFSPYAASNFQNVEFFYYNGTIIPSWLENYTSNHALYWIKTESIPASSSITVYMGFAPTSTNLFNTVNVGEAPTLSATYGQYDDGQNVFLEYGDFLNGAGFDGWTPYVTSGSFTPLATSNGIEMTNDSTSEGTHILPPNPLTEEPVIVEYSWNFYGGTSPTDGEILSLFGNIESLSGAPVVTCGGANVAPADSVMLMVEPVGMNCSGKYIPAILDNVNNKIISTVNDLPSITPQTYTEKFIVSSSIYAEGGVINKSSSLGNFSHLGIPITMQGSIPSAFNYPTLMVAAGTGGDYDYNYIRWLIARAYPPNGVMPSVTFGTVS